MTNFDFTLVPIDQIAKRVTSQYGCSNYFLLSRKDLVEIIRRLQTRHRELRETLGIKNKSQLKNRKYYRKHPGQNYNVDKELFQELLAIGHRINELMVLVHDMKHNPKIQPTK